MNILDFSLWEIAFIETTLLCNYLLGITTSVQLSPLKYDVLINKLLHKKPINCIIVARGNYFKTIVNVPLKQQCGNYVVTKYNVHTCDHATCPCVHHPLYNTFAINFLLWFPLIQVVQPIVCHYYLYFCCMCFILNDLICYGNIISSFRNHLWNVKEKE
jgi:hypothetical protein